MKFNLLTLILLSATLMGCCPPSDQRYRVGKDERSDLLVILKPEVTKFNIADFHAKALKHGDASGALPKGVQAFANMEIEGRAVMVINFFPHATASDRLNVKKRMLSSDLVDRVFLEMTPTQAVREMIEEEELSDQSESGSPP